jgi:hypothetical protein
VPFHVEIRHSFRRAWAFNLDQARLGGAILEPWRRGDPVELGDREWHPRDATLRVLEGPELAPPELAHGQGWHHAERSGHDVTAEALSRAATQATAVAVLGETPSAERAVLDLLEKLGTPVLDWGAVRARILAAATVVAGPRLDPGPVSAAVLAVEREEPSPGWLFEAGLALGALGGRAIVAQLGDQPPAAALRDLGVIRIDPAQPASLHALAERLRHAGAAPG